MSRNRWSRIARKAQKKFNIRYTTALQSCRDVHEGPDFDARMKTLRDQGLTYPDAMLQLIDEEFEFFDEEEKRPLVDLSKRDPERMLQKARDTSEAILKGAHESQRPF